MAAAPPALNKKELAAFDAVFEYLRVQNRPYSVNDIVQNLHKEHGKTAVQKVLDKLVQEEKVREKTYGKQKIYFISQALMSEASPEEIKEMDRLIQEKEKNIKELEAEIKAKQAELKAVNSSITTEEAKAEVEKLTEETASLRQEKDQLSSGSAPLITKEQREKMKQERDAMLKAWRQRKKICTDIINTVLESWPGTKDELFEELDEIETDEMVGAEMPKE